MNDRPPPRTPADPVARRRAQVAALSRDKLSLRIIAERVGSSKDTVRRDLMHIERATLRQPDATPETPRATPATPVVHVAVALDEELADDLDVLTSTGRSAPEALQHAAAVLASIYRNAWAAGHYPAHVEPQIATAELTLYTGEPTDPGSST